MRKLRLRPLLLGCMLLLGQVAWSNVRDVQMHFLGIKDGLSHQTANCFCQDEFGFIYKVYFGQFWIFGNIPLMT